MPDFMRLNAKNKHHLEPPLKKIFMLNKSINQFNILGKLDWQTKHERSSTIWQRANGITWSSSNNTISASTEKCGRCSWLTLWAVKLQVAPALHLRWTDGITEWVAGVQHALRRTWNWSNVLAILCKKPDVSQRRYRVNIEILKKQTHRRCKI